MIGEHTIDVPGNHLMQQPQVVDRPHIYPNTLSLTLVNGSLREKSPIRVVILHLEILCIAADIGQSPAANQESTLYAFAQLTHPDNGPMIERTYQGLLNQIILLKQSQHLFFNARIVYQIGLNLYIGENPMLLRPPAIRIKTGNGLKLFLRAGIESL